MLFKEGECIWEILKVKNEAENDLYKGKYSPDIDMGSDYISDKTDLCSKASAE